MKVLDPIPLIMPESPPAVWDQCMRHVVEAAEKIKWPPDSDGGKFIIRPESGKKRNQGNGVLPIKDAFLQSLGDQNWSVLERANPERFDAVRFFPKEQQGLDEPLVNLGLKKKTIDVLADRGKTTVGDLAEMTQYEFKKLNGVGKKSQAAVIEALVERSVLFRCQSDYIGVEWETGNISSGHRSVNRIFRGTLSSPKCLGGVVVAPTQELARYLTDRVTNVEELMDFAVVWKRMSDLWRIPLVILPIEHDGTDPDVERIGKMTAGRNLL